MIKYDQIISTEGKGTKTKTRDPAYPYICLSNFVKEIGFLDNLDFL